MYFDEMSDSDDFNNINEEWVFQLQKQGITVLSCIRYRLCIIKRNFIFL